MPQNWKVNGKLTVWYPSSVLVHDVRFVGLVCAGALYVIFERLYPDIGGLSVADILVLLPAQNEPVVADIVNVGTTLLIPIANVLRQPVLGMVYVNVGVPCVTPVTTPVVEPTVASDVLLELQVPPDVALV